MKRVQIELIEIAAGVMFVAGVMGSQSRAEEIAMDQSPWTGSLPPGRINLGIHAGDQQAETSGDVLIPVAAIKSRLVFINPRGAWNDEGGREFNIGVGCRQLFPDKNIITGLNVFYDLRESELDNRFNQFGLGAEILSMWVDSRANVYLPQGSGTTMDRYSVTTGTRRDYAEVWAPPTGEGHLITQSGYETSDMYTIKATQHFQMTEQGMEGFDAEMGALLPVPHLRDFADIKAFIGFYDFNAHYGRDVAGLKGRLEIRPLPGVIFDAAWFEDKAFLGSRYTVGIRASVPFDLAKLSHGRNPFAGTLESFKSGSGRPSFASRMTDMVIRDLHIRTDVSPLMEVVADRQVEQTLLSHERHDYHDVLASDVTFVDGDNQGGPANGTWEYPFPSIKAGIQGAVGSLVYVRDAAQSYREAVTLKEGQTLWGSGAVIQGRGNRFMGGIYPVLNSDGTGPAITLVSGSTVSGMGIVQSASSSPQDGIYGHNVTGITLRDNIVEGGGRMLSGIHLEGTAMPVFSAVILDNRISGAQGTGIAVNLVDVGETDLMLKGNQSTGNGGHGVSIDASLITAGGRIELDSLTTSGNQAHGIWLDINAYSGAVVCDIHNVVSENNRYCGLSGYLWGADGLTISATGNTLRSNGDSGMMLDTYSAASIVSEFISNDLSRNAFYGFVLSLDSGLSSVVSGRRNRVEDNGFLGFGLISNSFIGTYDFGTEVESGLNQFAGNGRWQVISLGTDLLSAQGNWWGTPTPIDGIDFLAGGGGAIDASHPLPAP